MRNKKGQFMKGNITKGMLGKHHSKESRRKMGEFRKGKKPYEMTDEIRKNISEATKKQWKLGKLKGCPKGRKHTQEAKKRMSETHKSLGTRPPIYRGEKHYFFGKGYLIKGENNPNWQGGKSFEPYGLDWTDDLKDSIRKRDNYICQLCGIHQDELNYKLSCHHIDYDKDNLNPDNLITLCRNCHTKTNFNRNYWVDYFKPLTTK